MKKQMASHTELDRVTSIIMYYFVASLNGVLGKTHLQKLMFLADLLASKKFGSPVTKMNYIRYTHGPYSKDLNSYIEKLSSQQLIEERTFPMISNPERTYSRFYRKKIVDTREVLAKEIGADKTLLLDEVIQSYGNKSLQDVLDFVYSLEEVNDAKFESPIKMAQNYSVSPSEEEPDDVEF